ncbi:unnamed protein product [Somion occarium]|uniref:SGTA homodimerisation domain-containing protein n=1 Tax=Somion occarium TaxID=3059160 RepID=A0ABP1CKQ3_9APHY
MSNKQRLVLSILDFLNDSIKDGTVKQDDQESLEVASMFRHYFRQLEFIELMGRCTVQCIGEAFGVDPTDEPQRDRLSVKPATLQSIFDVFLKTRDKLAPSAPAPSTSTPSSSKLKGPSPEDKSAAEALKAKGNSFMSSKNYDEAIASYTKAIELDPTNAVYYSNRAAAYSSKGSHDEAVLDADKAIEVDPSFVKAYHRLGHAYYCLNDYKAAAAAFRRGLELDPSNASLKTGLQNAEARATDYDDLPDLEPAPSSAPSAGGAPGAGGLGNMAEMLRNMGMGGAPGAPGGGGGMPDLASLMNNPQMMQMAQQMMANGGIERLMSNPNVANMMNRMQGGNMPDMSELMSDPTLRDMAAQFGGGGR